MSKIVGVWIYLCGLLGAAITGVFLFQVISVFPAAQLEAYGPRVPTVARAWAAWLPGTPAILWIGVAASAAAGLYLWRSNRPLQVRLFAAAVIAALNLFMAMLFATALLAAYFYLPRIANGA